MSPFIALVLLLSPLLSPPVIRSLAQGVILKGGAAPSRVALDQKIGRFELNDAIFRDGIVELSSNQIEGLHLGFEEILREDINDDPHTYGPHFSLLLENKTVREILAALCEADARYVWAVDGLSTNIYPRTTSGDPTYLLNREVARINLNSVPDPDQALTPLSKLVGDEQIGYLGSGDIQYAQPWTVTFEQITVRQLINRLAEHMGPRSAWIWQGSKRERMFTFKRGGFQPHSNRQNVP